MKRICHAIKTAPARNRPSGPSLETLMFKMGGFNGAVRRIISRWERPFTANQVKVALHYRHPEMIPLRYQIEDILDWLVFSKRLEKTEDGSFQHARPQPNPRLVIKVHISPRNSQLDLTFSRP